APPRIAERIDQPLSRRAEVHVRHAWPPNFTAPPEGRLVIMQPWEFGSLPQSWIAGLNDSAAEVWAYSRFVRDSYVASGIPAQRVHVVPLGVDVDRFRAEAPSLALRSKRRVRA